VDVTPFEPFSKVICPHCGETVRVRRKFDHFVITKQIGEGGMSRVFDATDETLGRHVALKILNRHFSKDAERMAQFEREARLTAAVAHPNVIKLYSVGRDQGNIYIAMELVGGGSMETRIAEKGKIEEREVLRIGRCIAEGLRSAYREGLIHRDVKPGNILFTDEDTPKIVDFGLALIHGRDVDESGEIWATPFYVAPEKVSENREDFRSDIYSLGATLYHALVGKPPYKADTNSIAELQKIKSKVVRLEDSGFRFAPRTCELINRMLALTPEERHQTYDELVEAFRDAESLVNYSVMGKRTQQQTLIYALAGVVGCAVLAGALLRPVAPPKIKTVVSSEGDNQKELTELGQTIEAGKVSVSDLFLDARNVLTNGNYVKAHKQFDDLISTKKAKQPTLNWARFNAALCAIVEGKKKDAEKYFEDIKRDADVGASIGGHDQREFFSKIGERMSTDLGLKFNRKDFDYDKGSEQVLGYLVHGLASWHYGRPKNAAEWLETFTEIQPAKGLEWITSYKKLIAPYLADVQVVKKLPDFKPVNLKKGSPAEVPKSVDEARKALDEAEKALAQLKTEGVYKRTITAYTKSLQEGITNFKRDATLAEAERLKEVRKRELAQLADINSDLPSLIHGYDFTHVVGFLKDIHFEVAEAQGSINNKLYLWSKAQEFMEQLMKDVNTRGYEGVITRRQASSVKGRLVKLNYTNASIALERGEVSIGTDALPPEMLVNMAQKFSEAVTDSTDYYRRRELIVIFAKVQGLDQMANAVAAQLMEENRSFRQRWTKVEQTGS
jgi:serine/threonine protein kinase